MRDIILMPNKQIGLNVAKYLRSQSCNIVALFFAENDKNYINQFSDLYDPATCQVFVGYKKHEDPSVIRNLPDFDFLITVYWPFLIGEGLLRKTTEKAIDKIPASNISQRSINFHPALLPINRGWYPHVHSILDGSPFGVSLHVIETGADTGPVWAQKELSFEASMSAGEIHEQLALEMERLFVLSWPGISSGKITPRPQDHARAIYHAKSEVDSIDEIDLTAEIKVQDFLNILRARTFQERGFAYYLNQNGERVYLHLRMNKTGHF